jgi:hypothetical protein
MMDEMWRWAQLGITIGGLLVTGGTLYWRLRELILSIDSKLETETGVNRSEHQTFRAEIARLQRQSNGTD